MALRAVIVKEFHQILRDPRTLGVLVFVPVFLLVMFGYAVNLDVSNAPIAVVDLDRSRPSREIIETLSQNGEYFFVYGVFDDIGVVEPLLQGGEIQGAVVIPRRFAAERLSNRNANVQIVVDGTNGTTAGALQGYLQSAIALMDAPTAIPLVDLRPRVWYNPELESSRYLIPGLVAFILVITAVISTALSIVREKELGTLEQIAASPLRPLPLILGKTIPYMIISIVIAMLVFIAGYGLFGVGVEGRIIDLAWMTVLFLFASLGLGIFISSIADSQQVAFMISILVTFLPAFILSGFIFPIENMPAIIRIVTYIVPARYFIAALRVIMLKGGGIEVFWIDAVFLAAFALVTITAGVVRLRRSGGLG